MTTDYTPQKTRLPDLPDVIPGIVAVRQDDRGRYVYTLQCERCFVTEEPDILVLQTIHFHARSTGGYNPRLCRDCRIEVHAGCTCYGCQEDRAARR